MALFGCPLIERTRLVPPAVGVQPLSFNDRWVSLPLYGGKRGGLGRETAASRESTEIPTGASLFRNPSAPFGKGGMTMKTTTGVALFRRRGRVIGIAASTIAMIGAMVALSAAPAADAAPSSGPPGHRLLPDPALIAPSSGAVQRSHVQTPAVAGSWSQQNEITGASYGMLGWSIAVSGKTMVVGAPNDNSGIGAAYVYTNAVSNSPTGWTQVAELTPNDGVAGDFFGSGVAIKGGEIVVGSACHSASAQYCPGAFYVYTGSGPTWTQAAEVQDPGQGYEDEFGEDVAIASNSVLVGALGENEFEGAVFVYTLQNRRWAEKDDIADPAATTNDLFGESLSVSKKKLVVGAPGTDAAKGAAYVFNEISGGWVRKATLTASNGEGCSTTCTNPVYFIYGDGFGDSVAIDKGTIVVGAPYASYPTGVADGVGSGSAYVFTGSGSTWTQASEIADPPEYDANNDDSPPGCTFFTDPCAAEDQFGLTVALLGTTVVAGAPYDSQGYPNYANGAAFVIPKSGDWAHSSPLTKLVASDASTGRLLRLPGPDHIGNGIIVVGSPYSPNGGRLLLQGLIPKLQGRITRRAPF